MSVTKGCSTCAYWPVGSKRLDDAPSQCWPCAGTSTLPNWMPKAVIPIVPVKAEGALKADDGKNPLALLPIEALEEVGKVLAFGAQKYAPNNWRAGFVWSRLLSAALRHTFAFIRGENKDPETGLSHLAHATCCLLFLLTFQLNGKGTDDRA